MASPDVEFTVDTSYLPKAGAGDLYQTVPAESSLDIKCPICLERFDSMFRLNPCLCKSCFSSAHERPEAKAACKQPGQSAFHSAEAEEDSKEYVSLPPENCALSKPDLWGLAHPTTREPDKGASLCRSSSSQQTGGVTSDEPFSDQPTHRGEHEIHEVIGLFAIRRLISSDRTCLGPHQEESAFHFIPVLQHRGVQAQEAYPHRDFSAMSQVPSLMNMLVVLVSSGVVLFVCVYLYLRVILLHK